MSDPAAFEAVHRAHPGARIVGASTGGEILGDRVTDETLVVAAISFASTSVNVVHIEIQPEDDSAAVGGRLAGMLAPTDAQGRPLAHVFVLADGILLNGSAFARGLEGALPDGVLVTGGLAGDADRFERTPLWADAPLASPGALAVGFYGADLRVGSGAAGGWDAFGPHRAVTRSEGNVLAELDGRSALALYEEYLGPQAADLPASGLLFPLSVRLPGSEYELVRTILGVDREAGTITFAGDVPEGATARLMRANPDRLIDGAIAATEAAVNQLGVEPELTLLVSCVGRKWALGPRIDEETEEASSVVGGTPTLGFYSYGELAPAAHGSPCELHNQTLTVTAFSEA